MKYLWRIVFIILVVIGCNRWENLVRTADEPAATVDEMIVSDEFDWRTSVNVAFYIKNAAIGVINITSEDQETTFHKGYYNGQTESYYIIVNLPHYMENVKINGELVAISSNVIIHTLSNEGLKSAKLKATASSLKFDGVDDYVNIDRQLFTDYPFTISAWIKTDGFEDDDEDMVIVSLADPDRSNRYFGIFIGEDENGRACIRARNGSEKTVYGNTVLTDGEWHQVVGVYSNRSDRKLYVDGELEATDGRRVYYSNRVDLITFGRWGDRSPKSYFKGNIDEVHIWNRALNAEEIAYLYENNPQGDEANLKAYYKFNTGEGSAVVDEISGSSEGEFNGGVQWSSESIGSGGIGVGDDDDTDGDGVKNADDDFPEDAAKSFINNYPASNYGTLAFEDLWPAKGDYDFNDLVIDYQFRTITNSENYVAEIQADFIIRAIGASFKNGFGFQFPNATIDDDDISVTGYNVINDYITLSSNGLESRQNRPTVIVFDNAFDIMPRIGGELGVNTDPTASVTEPDTVKIVITIEPGKYNENQINLTNFNPFIIVDMTRSKEIHLPDYAPTSLVANFYFNTLHDDSNITQGRYYKTENNLPWAINLYQSFDYPAEKNEIVKAYLKFSQWAESNGEQFPDWYLEKEGYRDTDLIY